MNWLEHSVNHPKELGLENKIDEELMATEWEWKFPMPNCYIGMSAMSRRLPIGSRSILLEDTEPNLGHQSTSFYDNFEVVCHQQSPCRFE